MALKPKHFPDSDPPPASKPAVLSGPWGRMNSTPRSAEVIRFCQGKTPSNQKTHSYPYRVLSSWHWSVAGDEEELSINAGVNVITVRGRGLDRVAEALDRGALETLAEGALDEHGAEQPPIHVNQITLSVLEHS